MRWKPGRRFIISVLVMLLLALGGAGLGGGWYYGGEIGAGALAVSHVPGRPAVTVAALSADRVTLRPLPGAVKDVAWRSDGLWGIKTGTGYGRVGRILAKDSDEVVREYVPVSGAIRSGQPAEMESAAFAGDPMTARGLPFQEVAYKSSGGEFLAWLVPGKGETWAIFVHGKGGVRQDCLRLLPLTTAAGYTAMCVTYRNDEGAAPSENGYYDWGNTEWQDLQGAVQYALSHGARDVILIGYSMGGGIVTNFLYQAPEAAYVRGAILDAPVLSLESLIDYHAWLRNVPRGLTGLGKEMARLRYGLDYSRYDYVHRASNLHTPVLLFHGDADEQVSITQSDTFAALRPDLITYIRVPGATHVRSWNMDADAYERAVRGFLGRLSPSKATAQP